MPQRPQFPRSLDTSTQSPLQSWVPAGHTQTPLSQLNDPGHTLSHLPQLNTSVCVATQKLPQVVKPALQVHSPPSQVWELGQLCTLHCPSTALPQALGTFILRQTPLQRVKPCRHWQLMSPFSVGPHTSLNPHWLPHAPQLSASRSVNAQVSLQSTLGGLHEAEVSR